MNKSKNEKANPQPQVSKAKGSTERMPKDQMPAEKRDCKGCKSK